MMTADTRIPDEWARNLVDPAAYADERLHETYTWLRANQPLGWAELEGFDPFWVVTKHADILDISRQNALFHSGDVSTTLTTRAREERARAMTGGSPHLVRSLVQMDAPDHMKYRLLTQRWFQPSNVRKLEDDIRRIAAKVVANMIARDGRCDFVADVALGYPLHVIMSILGVPEADEPRMLKLTQELFASADPDVSPETAALPPEMFMKAIGAVIADYERYFSNISAARRANPGEDLATVIANAEVDGKPISDVEAMGYYFLIATAGHDTTSSTIAGALWVLAERPSILARVQADPSLIPGLVDEAIRWTSPVKTFMRSATEGTELRGRRISRGDRLMLCYASGNRDEEVFEAPFEFRIERNPNKQLAFGYGAHMCLGQHLAKMEIRILFEALLPRLGSLALDGDPALIASCFVNGPKTLPIRFEMA